MHDVQGAAPLIGRHDELEVLDGLLLDAEAGRPAMGLVFGEAGVGKTTLVAEARRRAAARGFATASGGCADGSAEVPLAPLRSVLLGLASELGDPFRSLVSERAELAALLPTDGLAGATADLDAGRLYGDVLSVLDEVGRTTPLALVLEDLHWADRSTVELLAFLVRNLDHQRVAMLVTVRTEDLDRSTWSGRVLEELHRLPKVERLGLAGFDRTEVASLASSSLGSAPAPAVVDRLYERTGGNPFLTAELVASGDLEPGRLPDSLRGVLELRLSRLAPPTARLVRAAAALVPPIDISTVATVLAEDELDVEQELRAAIDAEVLQVHDGEPDFRHALLREAAYAQLLASERRRIHKVAAQAAEERGASPAVVAHHAERAGMRAEALVAWLAAAREAASGFAKVDAPPAYQRAVDLWTEVPHAEERTGTTRHDLLREAADASLAVGETDPGAAFAEQALEATDPDAATERWVDLALTLSELRWEQGRMLDGAALLDEVERLLDPATPSAHQAWLLERRSFQAVVRGEADEGVRLARASVEVARSVGITSVELFGLSGLGLALAVDGDVEASVAALVEARDRADDAGLARAALRPMINLLVVQVAAGDLEAAVAEGERGLEILARHSSTLPSHGTVYALLARALLQSGQVARAEQVLREAPPVAGRLHQAYLGVARAEQAMARGRFDEAARLLDGLAVELEANPYWAVQLSAAEAELALARGRFDLALACAERLVELSELWADTSTLRLRAAAIAAAHHAAPGQVEEHLAEARRRYAELVGAVEPLDADAWMAQIEALAAEDTDEAIGHWHAAAAHFSTAGHHLRALAASDAATDDAGLGGADGVAGEVGRSDADPSSRPSSDDGVHRFHDVEVDLAQYKVRRNGEPIHVEPQVFDVLALLIARRDRVVTKDELFEEVWGGPYVGEAALSSRIRDARKAVGDDGKAQHTIRTVYGRGYQFVADLDL